MIDTDTTTRNIRNSSTFTLLLVILVTFIFHTNQVDGWTLPPASDIQQQRRCRSRSRSSRCNSNSIQRHKNSNTFDAVGNNICFGRINDIMLFASPSTNPNDNDDNDNDGDRENKLLAENEQNSRNRNDSEIEKELLNDIFKGSSNSPSANAPDSGQELPFLDKAYFDPYAYDDDDRSFLGKIANFVKADYELFEAVFVSCFFLILISIAKDVLRAQMDAASSSTLF